MLARRALGKVVRDLRHQQGKTLSDLNDYISLGHLSEFERGENELSSEFLELVAQGLGVSAGYILIEAGYLMRERERMERLAVAKV